MQKMRKICLFVLLALASAAQGQSFRDIEWLKEMRRSLQTEDSLMRLGILKDEATGLRSRPLLGLEPAGPFLRV